MCSASIILLSHAFGLQESLGLLGMELSTVFSVIEYIKVARVPAGKGQRE